MAFTPVDPRADFPAQERALMEWWDREGIRARYLARNRASAQRWSFLDGPITANNPMGVHHAWGRSYKDLFCRYHTMLGHRQRYQNGFDCQGLWVEVEVEKELGFKSKRDIEQYGIAEFVERCKARVLKFAGHFHGWHDYALPAQNPPFEDRKSTRLNSSHRSVSRMPSSA